MLLQMCSGALCGDNAIKVQEHCVLYPHFSPSCKMVRGTQLFASRCQYLFADVTLISRSNSLSEGCGQADSEHQRTEISGPRATSGHAPSHDKAKQQPSPPQAQKQLQSVGSTVGAHHKSPPPKPTSMWSRFFLKAPSQQQQQQLRAEAVS